MGRRLKIRRDGLVAVLSLLLLVGALVGGIYFLHEKPAGVRLAPVQKRLDREIMAGARISSPQWGTHPRVQFDSLRLVKPRFGGISFGGFNCLEIDGLKLVLISATDSSKPSPTHRTGLFDGGGGLDGLFDFEKILRGAGISGTVSSVRIASLTLYVPLHEKLTEILCAKSAKSIKSGRFLLKECEFLDAQLVLQQVPEAELDVRAGIVIAGRSVVSLAAVADALMNMKNEKL